MTWTVLARVSNSYVTPLKMALNVGCRPHRAIRMDGKVAAQVKKYLQKQKKAQKSEAFADWNTREEETQEERKVI